MRRHIGEVVLLVASLCLLAGCGGGGGSSSSTITTTTSTSSSTTTTACQPGQTSTAANPCSAGAPSAKAAIEAAWIKFFNGATPIDQRIALLAGGEKFSSTLKTLGHNPLATKTSASVSKVTLTGPTTATVTFSVALAGIPVLTNVKGTAILQNGAWLVDPASLCQLLKFQGSAPAACSALGSKP